MSFAKKRSSYSTEKVKIVSVTASFGKKAKCFQPSVVICKINGKCNQTVFAGCAGKTSLTCQKAHVAFRMQNKQIVCTIFDKVKVWQNVQETFVKVQRNY